MFDFKDAAGDHLVDIDAEAEPLKRAVETLLVEETKLNVTPDGLSTAYVDPANVMMGQTTIPSDVFETYDYQLEDIDDRVVGLSVSRLQSALRPARMRGDDAVSLSLNQRQTDVWVDRAYGDDAESTFHSGFRNIDPESVRQSPDMDLDLETVTIDLNIDQLRDAVHTVAGRFDEMRVQTTDDGLRFGMVEDTEGSEVVVHGDYDGEYGAIYSKDYLTDITDAVKTLQPETVTVELGLDVPLSVEWERADGISGVFMLAPRIQK